MGLVKRYIMCKLTEIMIRNLNNVLDLEGRSIKIGNTYNITGCINTPYIKFDNIYIIYILFSITIEILYHNIINIHKNIISNYKFF